MLIRKQDAVFSKTVQEEMFPVFQSFLKVIVADLTRFPPLPLSIRDIKSICIISCWSDRRYGWSFYQSKL